jgi:hypothetical protein
MPPPRSPGGLDLGVPPRRIMSESLVRLMRCCKEADR